MKENDKNKIRETLQNVHKTLKLDDSKTDRIPKKFQLKFSTREWLSEDTTQNSHKSLGQK